MTRERWERAARCGALLSMVVPFGVGATAYAMAQAGDTRGACHASQPVYTSGYRLAGTWQATLLPRERVTLPDGDEAECSNGTLRLLGQDGQRLPQCPAEDSCTADYRNGAWHVTRNQH